MPNPSPYRPSARHTTARHTARTIGIWLLVIQVASVLWLSIVLYAQLEADPNFSGATEQSLPGFGDSAFMVGLGFCLFAVNCMAGLFWNLIAEKHHKSLVATATFFLIGYFAYFNIYLFKVYGADSYLTDGGAGWFAWWGYALIHFVHGGDLIDLLRQYGLHLQPIEYQSTVARVALVMFYAGAGVNLYQLLLLGLVNASPHLQALWEQIKRSRALLVGGALLAAYATALVQGWHWWSWVGWPLDNIVRTIDFMDVMQVFELRWHDAPNDFWNNTLAVVFRVGVALYALTWLDRMMTEYRGKLGLEPASPARPTLRSRPQRPVGRR